MTSSANGTRKGLFIPLKLVSIRKSNCLLLENSSSERFFSILISIVITALNYLELIKLLKGHIVITRIVYCFQTKLE